jgi:nitrogen-specific signal transduction histidine kinase
MLAFTAALPHIDRAVRIHRELRMRDLDHDTAPERLERLRRGVMLVDGAATVLFANAAARTLLGSGGGLTLKAGCLHSTDSADAVQGLIATCTPKAHTLSGFGGEISIHRGPRHSPLRVTVTPLRSKGTVAELPWLGLTIPVAIVTVADPASEKRMN